MRRSVPRAGCAQLVSRCLSRTACGHHEMLTGLAEGVAANSFSWVVAVITSANTNTNGLCTNLPLLTCRVFRFCPVDDFQQKSVDKLRGLCKTSGNDHRDRKSTRLN